jgi:hypothetical protein
MNIYEGWNQGSGRSSMAMRRSKEKISYIWGIVSKNLAKLGKVRPHNSINAIMEKYWCYFGTMPLKHLTGRDQALTLAIMKKTSSSACAGSVITESSGAGVGSLDLIESFVKLIKGGSIGPLGGDRGVIWPLSSFSPLRELARHCEGRAQGAAKVLEHLVKYSPSGSDGKVSDKFYESRKTFIQSYANFYKSLGSILSDFAIGEGHDLPYGRCGGILPGEVDSIFTAASQWNSEII